MIGSYGYAWAGRGGRWAGLDWPGICDGDTMERELVDIDTTGLRKKKEKKDACKEGRERRKEHSISCYTNGVLRVQVVFSLGRAY